MSRSKINFDEEGLPIPVMEKSKVSFDEEGLPVPSKKKVGSVDYSKSSLSSSTSNPQSQSEGEIPTVDLGKSILDNTVLGNMKPEEDESDIQSALNIGKLKGQGTYVAGGGTGGAGASFSIDPEASNKIVDLTGKLKQRGITQQRIDQIQQDFSDLPAKAKDVQITYLDGTVERPYSIESFNKLLSTDPAAYKSRLNTAKIYLNLHDKNEQAGNEFSLLQFQNASGDVNSDINKFQEQKAKQEEIIKNNLEGEQRNKALERLDENSSLWLNKEIPDSDEAAKYLTNKLYQSGKQDFNNPDLSNQSTEFTGNLNDVPLQEIKNHLDPDNKADVVAFSKYKNKVDLDEAVNHSGNLDEAAINYTAAQDPKVSAQLEMTGGQLPNSYKAQLVVDFLNNPEVLKKAQSDPQFKDEYLKTQQNLYFNYPEYAKKVVGSKIAQAREDAGMNNWLVNVPSKESTDKLVSKLVDEGKLSPQDAAVYQKQIRDELGGWESTKRGVGRLVPFLQTQVDESPIPTPGFLESAENSYVNTLSNTAKSVKDVATLPSMVLGTDDSRRLYNSLSEQYSKAAMAPKGLLHQASEGAGNLTGFIIPMMVGGAALKAVKGGEFITNALMFEGQNRDAALNLFPDDPIKRYLYTNIATAGDVMLGHLLPVKDANEGVGKVFKNDIKDIITDLTNNKITQEEAKKTLLQKAADIAPELLKENAKTAGVMTGFGVLHNTLDALFGANDMSAGDIAYDAVKSFKTNFLSTPLLTAMSVYGKAGNNPKFNGKMLMEAADNPEGTRKTIEEQSVKSPVLEAQKDEMLTNLNEVASIKKDLDKTSLTEPQKEKYLVEAINQKIWERKASETEDDKIKEKYLKKASVHSENKQEILSDKDKAKEFQEYAKTQGVVVTPPDNMPESVPLKTEEQSRTENGVTVTPPLTTGESVPLGKETEQEMPNQVDKEPLQQAKDIINTTEIKGYSAEPLKEAVKNGDDETLNKYLKNIAEQAHDEKSLPTTIDTYGKDLVDVTQKMFPDENKNNEIQQPTEGQGATTTEPNKVIEPTKEGTGGKEPPIEEPELVKNNGEDEDWAAVRKAKLKEISGVKEMIEKRQPKGWTQTFQNAAENVQKMFPKKSLYGAMKARVNELKLKLEAKELYNPTSEDNAVFTMLRAETHKRINDVEGQDSDNPIVRQAANMELESLHNDLMDIARVTNPEGEAGRAFNILQSEAKFNKDNGLKIRRMQMIKAKGGEPLTPEENKWSSDQWEKEKDIMKQEQEVKEKAMQDEFDAKISELQKQYEKGKESKGKEDKPNDTVKKLSQRGKDIADKIRKLKKPKDSAGIDFTFGTWDVAIEGIAKLVEAGSTIAEAIDKLVKDGVLGFRELKDREEFEKHIAGGIPEMKSKSDYLQAIRDFSKENDTTDITKDMVEKNLIRDYINSHIGEVEQKDILDTAFKDLKEILPSATKDRMLEAYLRENEFKLPTKKVVEGGIADAKKELVSIAKLEEDIKDLEGLKTIRQRSFPTERAKSEYEQKLFDEKNAKVKDISDRNKKIKEDNARIETERNRQQKKVGELIIKREKLLAGVKDVVEKRDIKFDTPEIEGLREEVRQINKAIREAEAAQRAAERKVISDRNKSIKKGNKIVEAEAIRQVSKVQELQAKKEALENGIREKREVIKKEDTPEIEAMKAAVKVADDNLRAAEVEARRMSKEIQDKKDKIGELEANIERAKNDRDLIKTHKNKSEVQIDEEIAAKQKELKKAVKDNSSDERVQDKKLEDAKKNAVKQKEEFQRKLDEGEFEEAQPVKLKKKDAELIRLEKDKSIIEEAYRKKQKEILEHNKPGVQRGLEFARSAFVALMIGMPKTLAKVGSMAISRPIVEALRKLTFGKIFDRLFPGISKVALRGGESTSMRSIKESFKAYFRHIGEDKLERIYDKASRDFKDAQQQYSDYKNSSNPDAKKLEQLKKRMNDKLIDAQSSFIYKFIGGSNLKDSLTALVNRANEIEKQFGHVEGESIKDGDWLDKANYVIGFIGRSHSAAKTFSGRANFAAGFMARLEGAVKNGEDISDGNKILEIAHESYLDWERGKYQQSNAISDLWSETIQGLDAGQTGFKKFTAKAAKLIAQTDIAITRVPVNILHEAVMEYALGAFRVAGVADLFGIKDQASIPRLMREMKAKLKDEGLTVNTPEFKAALKERINQMDEKQAATIARAFSKGGLGMGLYALATITAAIHFGIYPHMGQKKKKDEKDLKKDELNPGQVMIGDSKQGEVASALISHVPALWPTFMGLGIAQAYHDDIDKGKTTRAAAADAIYQHLEIIQDEIPQAHYINPLGTIKKVKDLVTKRATEMGIIDDDKSLFTKEEQQSPTIQKLKERGIELKLPVQAQHKVDIDDNHPQGIMMPDEWDKFQKLRKDIIMKGIPERKENHKVVQEKVEGIDEILNTTYHVTTKDSRGKSHTKLVQGKDLTDEQLKSKVQSLQEKATEYANNKMGLKAEKPKTTVKKGR